MRNFRLLLILCSPLPVSPTLSGWSGPCTPVIAKERGYVVDVDRAGKRTLRETTDGTFRNSSGDTLIRRWDRGAGSPENPAIGYFRSRARGLNFKLDYRRKEARRLGPLPPRGCAEGGESRDPSKVAAAEPCSEGMVCSKIQLEHFSQGGQTTTTFVWRNLLHDLDVKYETEFRRNGSVVTMVTELHDIRIGASPPPGTIGIPASFHVVGGKNPAPRPADKRATERPRR